MTVRNKILDELAQGVVDKDAVLTKIVQSANVTSQAVYKELRRLIEEDVVISKDRKLSLTFWFIEKQLKHWKEVSNVYTGNAGVSDLTHLQRGQWMKVTFHTLRELDAYWTQSFLILERILPESFPTYAIIPHDWFYYARPQSDEYWTNKQTRPQRLLITHPASLDLEVIKERRRQGYQYTVGENPFHQREDTYFTVISDWLFAVKLDRGLHQSLRNFITGQKNLESINEIELQSLLTTKGTCTLKIHHHPKKTAGVLGKVKKFFE